MSKFFDLSGGQKTLSVFFSVVLSLVVITAVTEAASTISTNIQTDGTLSVTGVSTFTGLVTSLNASTTLLSNTGVAYFGGTATTTIGTAGFVGVGTSSPWGMLSVNPTALGSGIPEFVIGSSTATRVIVDGTGNVGIGNSGPTTKLEVTGTASSSAVVIGGGTTVTRMQKGTCDILISGPLAASTTTQWDCAVTGVQSGDTVFVQTPITNRTYEVAGGFATSFSIVGANASTTAGYITFKIANNTGAASTTPAFFASSTQYLIVR